ncbi:MAG: DUF3348 family protein [Piscinibacter sp.]|uniref:DUF3348 family protein n=1 Tax=Piscinibacter sp. TaxID=1903157 RepID=UPI002583CDA4|nr:DUF3348 family protein [Piscinibacter sp.]MCW5667780.1 DUF3348 family protein [Piscinibacter sp.]
MQHGLPDPGVAGSELTRFLARLAEAPAASARPAFSERLGQWLSWTGAISLSAALNAGAASPTPRATRPLGHEEADFQRVRAALQASIDAGPDEPASSPTDFGPHRRHCAARQHAMQEAVGALRQRLREALAQRSAAGARLAAIDAVLDGALAAQERSLLGLVPLRLQAHFERLQRGADPHWADRFRADRDHLLRAELAHRLLPVQGLLDTLRTLDTP